MTLVIPVEASAAYGSQGAPDNTDFAALVAGAGWNGVVSGCAVTGQSVANMSVQVASGVVAINGAVVNVAAVASLTIAAAGAADRRDIVVVNNAGVVSVVQGTTAGAVNGVLTGNVRDPGKPAIPSNSVLLAEVYVAANTTSITTATNITDKSMPVPTTAPAGLTIPAGQALTTGTRSVVTGSRSVTTNASDTVDLGTFATTGGALELRIHAHLAAPAAGTTASVTKVYEIAAGALMGTVSTWYLCLPADASANAASSNDFALEVQRTAAGTFKFRLRQKSIDAAGAITFSIESLGDTLVTFTPSTTVTATPTAVTVLHPSNGLCTAAGNVGIGTESPSNALSVAGGLAIQRSDSSSSLITATAGAGSTDGRVTVNNAAAAGAIALAAITTAGTLTTDSVANDAVIGWTAGQALRLGVFGGPATLAVTGSDVQINDNGTARSVPRGTIGVWRQGATNGTTISNTTAETAIFSGVGSFPFVSGRRYLFLVRLSGTITTASTSARFILWLKLGTGTGGTLIGEDINSVASTASALNYKFWAQGVAGTDFAAGTSALSITGQFSLNNTFTPLAGGQNIPVSAEIIVCEWGD